MKRNKNEDRIAQLLAMAWSTSSPARELAIANQILEIDPDNIEALIIKADQLENPNKRLELLEHALKALDGQVERDEKNLLFISINHRIAYTYMGLGNLDKAFECCQAVLKFCDENSQDEFIKSEYDETMIKTLFYRILIERHAWQKILTEAMRDTKDTLARAYAKLIAAWFMAGGNAKKICANLLWDALSIAPDVPFYILGYFEEPHEHSEPEAFEDFSFALMYYDTVAITDELFNWFSRGVILFGMLSGRFDRKEQDYLIDVLDSLGGFEEYERMKNIIVGTEDRLVLEALAAHRCLTN